jgi:hypothetical protein
MKFEVLTFVKMSMGCNVNLQAVANEGLDFASVVQTIQYM